MSGEDTELTFIRCPSCRSLVPAVATRCRMCGHQFGSQESSEPSKNKMKQVADDVEESVSDRNVLYSEPEEKSSPAFEAEYDDMAEEFSDEGDDEEVEEDFPSQQGSANGTESSGRRKRRRRRKKKNQEQGNIQEAPRVEARIETPRAEVPRMEPHRVETPRVETSPRTEFISRKEIQPEQRSFEQPRASRPAEQNVRSAEVSNGVLVGWLVNYAQNANGSSIELRSGKYFVARQRLRDDDLVIPDSAISTPHCLIKASKGALQLQDLMSEQGTFVKKSGSNNYVPVEEAGVIEHGDRVRFGAYEVVVCLVP